MSIEDAIARSRARRRKAGLPDGIEDPVLVARIVSILDGRRAVEREDRRAA